MEMARAPLTHPDSKVLSIWENVTHTQLGIIWLHIHVHVVRNIHYMLLHTGLHTALCKRLRHKDDFRYNSIIIFQQ